MPLLLPLALIFTSFSLLSALVLALTHFRGVAYQDLQQARWLGLLFVAALAGLQLAHFAYLWADLVWQEAAWYRLLLFVVAPSGFLFSQAILQTPPLPLSMATRLREEGSVWQWSHALPALCAPVLAVDVALPSAFILGAGYLLALGRQLYVLREVRQNFQREFGLLVGVFILALGVSLLSLAPLPAKVFFTLYSLAIGLGFFLVQIALGLRPQLSSEVHETVQQSSYAVSTLKQVDCAAMLARLETLMQVQQLYTQSDFGLADLAKALELSTHQTSELLNARLGKGFARYLREQRIAAAKAMLCNEPNTAILAIGLNVGFAAQSSFYEAFREIEGMTPGQYRKVHRG